MKNRSLTQSMLQQQCPNCRTEPMFTHSVFSRKFMQMQQHCPHCGQSLEPEPGFYTGAMYVSYAFQVALIAAVVVVSYVFGIEGTMLWYLSWITGLNLLLFPLSYRLSRSVWAHMFIAFRGKEPIKAEQS